MVYDGGANIFDLTLLIGVMWLKHEVSQADPIVSTHHTRSILSYESSVITHETTKSRRTSRLYTRKEQPQ